MSCLYPDEHRSSLQPVRYTGNGIMPSQVNLERSNGGCTLLDRIKIGALAGILTLACRSNPVDRAAIRVFILEDLLGFVPEPESRRPDAGQVVIGSIRYIDVEDRIGRQAKARELLDEFHGYTRRGIKMLQFSPNQRPADQ